MKFSVSKHGGFDTEFLYCQKCLKVIGNIKIHKMSKEEQVKKVVGIVVEQLGVNEDQVKPESKLVEDLGADSLDAVELVMAIEEEFGIDVPDEEAEKLLSVGDILTYIEKNTEA